MRKINIGIIGATGTAYKRVIPAIRNSDICTVIAIQGRNIDKLKSIQQEYTIPYIYTDVTEILNKSDIDCIYIATPPFLHIDGIRLAASYNKPIICEKPLCVNYSECHNLETIPSLYDRKYFMIAHHLRHQNAIKKIKEIIENGQLGKILNVYMQWGFMMNEDASNYEWKSKPVLSGGGALNDVGIHLIDLSQYLFGNPKTVFGSANNVRNTSFYDDETSFLIYDGFCVTIHASQSISNPGNHLLIYGSDGTIEAFDSLGEQSITSFTLYRNGVVEQFEYPNENLYKNEIEGFCKSLQNVPANEGTSLLDGILAMKIIDDIQHTY